MGGRVNLSCVNFFNINFKFVCGNVVKIGSGGVFVCV